MGLNPNRNNTDYDFRHQDQVDEYGAQVAIDGGDYTDIQKNFDTRAEDNLTDTNNIKDTLRSVTDGDSGADNTGATPVGVGTAETTQGVLEEQDAKSDTNAGNIATNTGNIATNTGNIATNTSDISYLQTADGQNVKLTGNQSIADVKTFTSSPIIPEATTPTAAINKEQTETLITEAVVGGATKANQAEAEAGTNDSKWMTPLQTVNSINANVDFTAVEADIAENTTRIDNSNLYKLTGSSVVTDHIAFTLDQDSTYDVLTNNEEVLLTADEDSFGAIPVNEYLFDNDGVNTALIDSVGTDDGLSFNGATQSGGKLTLDGTDDYGTLPASVGQLTDGIEPFEMIVPYNRDDIVGNETLMSKRDTGYAATTNAKGWFLDIASTVVRLGGNSTNGSTLVTIVGTTVLSALTDYWIKLTFDGTTVELLLSTDEVTYISEVTSTDANLITALTITDAVDTNIGRVWFGSAGYLEYFNGSMTSISLFKGLITGTPTLKIDGTAAKEIQGVDVILAGNTYKAKYNSTDDKFDVAESVFVPVSQEWTSLGTVTLTGDTAQVDFDNIDSKYNFLKFDMFLTATNPVNPLGIRFNDDATTTYGYNNWQFAAATADTQANENTQNIMRFPQNSINAPTNLQMLITNAINQPKVARHDSTTRSTGASYPISALGGGVWTITDKITKISVSDNFFNPARYLTSGTIIELYGKE